MTIKPLAVLPPTNKGGVLRQETLSVCHLDDFVVASHGDATPKRTTQLSGELNSFGSGDCFVHLVASLDGVAHLSHEPVRLRLLCGVFHCMLFCPRLVKSTLLKLISATNVSTETIKLRGEVFLAGDV